MYSAEIFQNKAFAGAGLYIGSNSTLTMGRSSTDQCNIAQCSRIINNKAISSRTNIESFAGGLYSETSAVSHVSQTWVSRNSADYIGALSIGQGSVKHTMITNNQSLSTDGDSFVKSIVSINGPVLDFTFNTLAKNSFSTDNVAVLSVLSESTDINLAGNIIQENVFVNDPESVYVNNINALVNCSDNLLEAATATSFCLGSNNLDMGDEAMFVDAENNDFHITPQSLAVNHAASVPIGVDEKDIDNDVILIADAGADETLEPRIGLNGGACQFVTITEALNAASIGDVLFLSPGIYNESILIGQRITVQGASADCTSAITDGTSDAVFIDGTGVTDNNALLVIQGNHEVNLANLTLHKSSRGGISKFSASPEDSAAIRLSDVTVVSNASPFDGAGIFVSANALLELRGNTTVSNNFSLSVGAKGGGIYIGAGGQLKMYDNASVGVINQPNIADNGGGIYIDSATLDMFDNTSINANLADSGGGIYVNGIDGLINIRDCTLELNHADRYGGAVYLKDGGILMGGCQLMSNSADLDGGALYIDKDADSVFDLLNSDFEANSSGDKGGALFIKDATQMQSPIVLDSISFLNNTTVNQGGAIFLGSMQSLIFINSFMSNCLTHIGIGYDYCSQFIGNTTSAIEGVGGAIYSQGDININQTSFKHNNASLGSAIYSITNGAGIRARYVLFADHLGESALHIDEGSGATILSSTLVNNRRSIFVSENDTGFSMNRSILWGDQFSSLLAVPNQGTCNIDGFGEISDNTQDPLFETGPNGIAYQLSVNSPAIDQCFGTQSNSSPRDLIGNISSADGNFHLSPEEDDMGAFEYLPEGSQSLTVNKIGTGTGTVISEFGDINCGDTCSDQYPTGLMVTLQATPDDNMLFSGWSGGSCFGTAECVVTLSQSLSITAQFENDEDLIFKHDFE